MQCIRETPLRFADTALYEGTKVHPAFHKKNLLIVLNWHEIQLATRHAKVRRNGYAAAHGRRKI